MPKAQSRAHSSDASFRAALADVFRESADCLVALDTLWSKTNAENDSTNCLRIAAAAINHIHHAWSSFAGLDEWLARLGRDLPNATAFEDIADEVRVHCAAIVAHHLSDAPFTDPAPRSERLATAISLLVKHGNALPANELFSASRSLLDFIEIENEPDGFEAILMLLESRRNDADLNPLWQGRALVYGGRCYLLFNLQQNSKRFRERALKLWLEVRALARMSNLPTLQFDVVHAELLDATTRGEIDAVPLLLTDMEGALDSKKPMQLSEYFVQRAKLALFDEDAQGAMTASADALRYVKLAIAPEKQIGVQVLARVWALALGGEYAAARETLAVNIASQSGRPKQILTCIDAFLNALAVRFAHGAANITYRQALTDAMSQAASLKWPNYLSSLPKLASLVSADALNADIHAPFVRATITQRKLPPPSTECAMWPWPLLITTFGGFSMTRFGEPIEFEGKVQKKPLELLKCIASAGARGLSIQLVGEMLWPEAESEQARTSFKVTLSRLRKLLDVADAIDVTDTRVSINRRVVRVDCTNFEAAAEGIESAIAKGEAPPVLLAEQFAALYRGRFLGDEACNRWLQSSRERWHTRFVRVVIAAGTAMEVAGLYDEAVSLYEQAVQQDSLSEDLHRHLIAVHIKQGEHAAALNVFRRLRQSLSLALGVMPSEKTLALVTPLGVTADKHANPTARDAARPNTGPNSRLS
jgi:LuxR family transcriptional regulator, maltose regulon positive regulatory protein